MNMNKSTTIGLVLVLAMIISACAGPAAGSTDEEPVLADLAEGSGYEEFDVGQDSGIDDLPLLYEGPPVLIEEYVLGIAFPTRMALGPNGELFVTEKAGSVRVISPEGELQPEAVFEVEVDASGEQGLLGIAISPDYNETGHVWIYYTVSVENNEGEISDVFHRIGRFTVDTTSDPLTGGDLEIAWEIRDAFTESTILNGGDIKFGPEGDLYISVGSTNNILVHNDRSEPHGKIHRFIPGIPLEPSPENINGDSVYAYGFRHAYGFTFHPETGVMYATENGPDCADEINQVWPGADYGWREDGLCEDNNLSEEDYPERFFPPVVYYTPPVSPTGITFYTGDKFPDWQNRMLFCVYNFGEMYWLDLEDDGFTVERSGIIRTGDANCAVDILTGPDGYIYFSDITGIHRVVPAE
ncbi:MAG: PQQ-dependent sugar dehydrogenase [Anaerolineae bacterium]